MIKEGKYIYCIIQNKEDRNFGSIGIGGRGDEVTTISYKNLAMVISNSPMEKYMVSRENLLAHQKVIEEVMKDYTVLPVRFCTIASNADEIRNLLDKRYLEFKNLLRDMDNKIELGVKAWWKDMNIIFNEIVEENKEIKRFKEKISKESIEVSYMDRIEIGKMVQTALENKKEKEAKEIFNVLRKSAYNAKNVKVYGDNMILNAAFLIDRAREKEFDTLMDNFDKKYGQRIKFNYVGPVPPYNFVNIVIYND
ncbi:MAG: GvpL/GvpF family gas vesicle protein [Acidobacteriota bacterium]